MDGDGSWGAGERSGNNGRVSGNNLLVLEHLREKSNPGIRVRSNGIQKRGLKKKKQKCQQRRNWGKRKIESVEKQSMRNRKQSESALFQNSQSEQQARRGLLLVLRPVALFGIPNTTELNSRGHGGLKKQLSELLLFLEEAFREMGFHARALTRDRERFGRREGQRGLGVGVRGIVHSDGMRASA